MKRYFIYRHEYMAEDTYIGNMHLSLSLSILYVLLWEPHPSESGRFHSLQF